MNWAQAEKIADAVLYEGYLLYPYRPSAIKNRQRWNFGVVYPRAHSERQNCGDPWTMHTECLVQGDSGTSVQVRVRCLQLSIRSIGELGTPLDELPAAGLPAFHSVEKLAIGDRVFQPWQEAVVQEVTTSVLQVSVPGPVVRHSFDFPSGRTVEPLRNDWGKIAGVIIREQCSVDGVVEISANKIGKDVYKLTVTIQNTSACDMHSDQTRDGVLAHSMLSAHTIVCVENGRFVSLLEPAEEMVEFVADCHNSNTWPVLVGEAGSRDVILSSPIILYDYPQIAPESPGDLFDGTEIDEILALRIMTMTDEEKKEIRQADPRGRELLERTETLPAEHLMKLHGVLRGLRPSEEKAS